MGKHKHVIIAVVVTWLVVSFVPQLSLTSFFGGLTGKGKKA